ncbi:MAG: PIN domain-containing protein [Steroidobacteraceae bacterium]|jgi:predicted nucleic acid-binding protein
MSAYLDSSVLVAALSEDEPNHEICLSLLTGKKKAAAWTHAIAEVFATLSGGRLGIRVAPSVAAELIEQSIAPRVRLFDLAAKDVVQAIRESESAGVRGGAMFDFLHLAAARKLKATVLYTLNVRHFSPLVRKGDPAIEGPVRSP